MRSSRKVLPVIVISVFCSGSLWFAGNGVMNNLVTDFKLPQSALGHLTSAVQFGFITGTSLFSFLTLSDRFSPSKVFFASAIAGALFNLAIIMEKNGMASLFLFRSMTGFFLAGIYPVAMKIAADHFEKGLGKSLGYLVGALVLGTAFPYFLKEFTHDLPWRLVIIITSATSILGGISTVLLVADGPYRKKGQKFDPTALFKVFNNREFRKAAFGYFGHMWELYAFWTFVPIFIASFALEHRVAHTNVPLLSFLIIGVGGLACVAGGYLSQYWGPKKTASFALLSSGMCCLISPLVFVLASEVVFVTFLLFWGMVVIADSPLFSTLVANNAIPESKGTALTIVNCIGFSITILSIQLLGSLQNSISPRYLFILLAMGPLMGLLALYKRISYTPKIQGVPTKNF